MLHLQNRSSKIASRRRGLVEVWLLATLLVVSALAAERFSYSFAAGLASASNSERTNPRSRPLSANFAKPTSPPLSVPLVSIDVDRTDDNPAAAACTAAANDCSLRGAISFANLNPGTVINL